MTELSLDDVVLDKTIYPRADWSQPTADRYAEAIAGGDQMPPIVLEQNTNRLLDGMHRYQAHRQLGRTGIAVEFHEIPSGMPAKLYAAGLSARHGDRMTHRDLQAIAREIITANPDYSMQTIAKQLAVTRQTIGRWAGDITERRRTVRRVRSLLLSRLGWSNPRIGEFLDVTHPTVAADLKEMSDVTSLSEEIIRESLEGLPSECAAIADEIREERIFAAWSDDERELLKRLRAGETIVVSYRIHGDLIAWCEQSDLLVRIDRKSDWGNPFVLPDDGDRDTVIGNYVAHYLPYKPSLAAKRGGLAGKALACWCAPESCHGDALKAWAEDGIDTFDELARKATPGHEMDEWITGLEMEDRR